ncbi:MAG: hypothetical protein ACD_62C00154G0005 [uncultured bacterium]|nr:MAG: hypothetical protein ACD_62C00154G0005 [uncultured bacterium]HLD45381.1 type II toxin-antitoxin system RelE/ParE family toxin [bacterium]
MSYRIFETRTFQKQLHQALKSGGYKKLDRKIREYVYPLLRAEPHFGMQIKKLKDFDPETYRFRIGDFRLFYSIDEEDKVVVVTAIKLRGSAY